MTRSIPHLCRLVSLALTLIAIIEIHAGPALAVDTIRADSVNIYPLGPARGLTYHVRALPERRSCTHLTMYWNYTDSMSFRSAVFELPPALHIDTDTPVQVKWTLSERKHGADSITDTGKTWLCPGKTADAAISLVLRADAAGAVLELADSHTRQSIPVAFDRTHTGSLALFSDRTTVLTKHTIIAEQMAVPERLTYTADSLRKIIAMHESPLAGVWTYLDRKTIPAKAVINTDYTFATLPQDDGTVLLVLLSDTPVHKSMTVKGRLIPTPFMDHYDLEWITADGLLFDSDTSADVQVDGMILSLNFPLLEATVRFRRQRLTSSQSDN